MYNRFMPLARKMCLVLISCLAVAVLVACSCIGDLPLSVSLTPGQLKRTKGKHLVLQLFANTRANKRGLPVGDGTPVHAVLIQRITGATQSLTLRVPCEQDLFVVAWIDADGSSAKALAVASKAGRLANQVRPGVGDLIASDNSPPSAPTFCSKRTRARVTLRFRPFSKP